MRYLYSILFVLLLMDIWSVSECKRGGGSSWGRRGGSRGKSASTTSSSSGGWFSWSNTKSAPAPAPAPKQNYGWTAPKPAPAPAQPGWATAPKPSAPATGWAAAPKPAAPATGWAAAPKPAASAPVGTAQAKPSYGWQAPGSNTNVAAKSNQPSGNIGPGGYPVQGGVQRNPPPYSPQGTHVNPPAYSPSNTHGSSYNPNTRVAPPSYSASNPHPPPAYSGPKKQTINNHYHYGSPPAYTPSNYGMGHNAYPTQNGFGYPSGSYFGNNRPQYGGMGLFGGNNNYGYSGGGSWGGYPSYGSSNNGGMVKGLLIGAAGGYLANSLIRRVTNPWGYSGHGYGYGYQDRYRYDSDRDRSTPAPPVVSPPPPDNTLINCVAYDKEAKTTLLNPNCTCTTSFVTDPVTGVNTSHHDCTPLYFPPNGFVEQPSLPVYGVNNPPPSFQGVGSLYGAPGAGAGSYGAGYGTGTGYGTGAAPMPPIQETPNLQAGVAAVNAGPPQGGPVGPISELQVSDDVEAKKREAFKSVEKLVSMGSFAR